jgi:nucleoside-diphosphate-sugar epimerase
VDAIILGLTVATQGECYNLGGESPIPLLELAGSLISANGGGQFRRIEFPAERKGIDVGDVVCDHGKFSAATGWEPRVPLNEGLRRVLTYYRRNLERYI